MIRNRTNKFPAAFSAQRLTFMSPLKAAQTLDFLITRSIAQLFANRFFAACSAQRITFIGETDGRNPHFFCVARVAQAVAGDLSPYTPTV